MKNQFVQDEPETGYHYVSANDDYNGEYPRCLHHPVFGPRLAATPEAAAAMGDGWYDTPADFPEVLPAPQGAVEGCPGCEALVVKFDLAWAVEMEASRLQKEEIAELRSQIENTKNKKRER